MSFTLAIIGRPNVGKSTLFNRLVGKRLALVDDQPGVTRDRREGEGRLYDLTFKVIDTAGLEEADGGTLEGRMRQQTERALAEADLAVFIVDARAGVTPLDAHFAEVLRRSPTPVILIANKCEGRAAEAGLAEAWRLGMGEPVPFSAEHGLGISDLHDAILERLTVLREDQAVSQAPRVSKGKKANKEPSTPEHAEDGTEGEEPPSGPLQLAIVGRPNVGKSTLVNRMIGEDRLLTGPEAGITRDAISLDWEFRGVSFRLVDTAGLRRRAKVTDRVERLSAYDTKRAIDYAQVVVLLLDGQEGLHKQDLWIARTVIEEGRALVIGLNKWDALKDSKAAISEVQDRMIRSLPQVKGIPLVPISGLTGRGLDRLMDAVLEVYETWQSRISTARLNRWLSAMLEAHPPPMVSGRRLKIRYVTQVKSRPPTFALWVSRPKELPDSYVRYLENGMREDFDMPAVPIRFLLRKGDNPYA